MATGQADVSNPVAKANATNKATQALLRATEAYVTLDNALAPLFKIGEKVCFLHDGNRDRGGTIHAFTRRENSSIFVYEILPKSPHTFSATQVKAIPEGLITSSDYTVGDVVLVEAFGKKVRRTILRVFVSSTGVFTYDVGGGFEARNEDVLKLAGRRR